MSKPYAYGRKYPVPGDPIEPKLETARPFTTDELRRDIYAAGERVKRERARDEPGVPRRRAPEPESHEDPSEDQDKSES